MRHFFDSKHIDDLIASVAQRYPEEMKEGGARMGGPRDKAGGRAANRDLDGKWGLSQQTSQNSLYELFDDEIKVFFLLFIA
jgi:hypothetical protein